MNFTGWEIVGYLIWILAIVSIWWAARDRKETLAEKDREWARRHHL